MTYSIGVYFDHETEVEIRRIWQILAEFQIADYLHLSNNRPHLTLSIFEDLDLDKTSDILCGLADEFPVLEISFQSVGIFPYSTVFLAPLVSHELLNFQRTLHEKLVPYAKLPEIPYFLPGLWVPHCSMAIDFLPGKWIDAVQKILEEIQLPLNGKISELGLTSYRPVVHLQNCKLSGN